jgi:hypothetical protein
LTAICTKFKPRQVKQCVPRILSNLLAEDWPPTQSCGLLVLPRVFSIFDGQIQKKLLGNLLICAEGAQAGLLRRAVITALTDLLPNLPAGFEFDGWIGIVKRYSESSSYLTAAGIPRFLSGFLKVSEDLIGAIEIGTILFGNSNWRVRLAFVEKSGEIFGQFTETPALQTLLEALETAASDAEEEIRIGVCCQLPHFKVNWESIVRILQNDRSERVKLALIETLVQSSDREFAKIILLGLVQENNEIGLAALKALKKIEVTDDGFIENILHFLKEAVNWRDRIAVCQAIPGLEVRSREIVGLLFNDPAISVRYALLICSSKQV